MSQKRVSCPVCGEHSETGRASVGADALQVDCPRCGPYVISETALAMLPSRLERDARAPARMSHAIRSRTSRLEWFEVNSTNLTSLVAQPLPAPEKQLSALLNELAVKAGDGYFTPVRLGDLRGLASLVGAPDESALSALIGWAEQQGFLKQVGEEGVTLTPQGWESIKAKPVASTSPIQNEKPEVEKVRGHCPRCGPNVNALVVASHTERWEDDDAMLWAIDTYRILKCPACDSTYVQKSHSFSEDVEYRDLPDGGWEQVEVPKVTYWPSPSKRPKPSWIEELDDEALKDTLDEVYGALDEDQRILAAIGVRTALDRAMVLLGATADTFAQKLAQLADSGTVGSEEKEGLIVLTDAGSASAHRAWKPKPQDLDLIMSGMEAFLYRTMVLAKGLGAMKSNIPPRPKSPKKSN